MTATFYFILPQMAGLPVLTREEQDEERLRKRRESQKKYYLRKKQEKVRIK